MATKFYVKQIINIKKKEDASSKVSTIVKEITSAYIRYIETRSMTDRKLYKIRRRHNILLKVLSHHQYLSPIHKIGDKCMIAGGPSHPFEWPNSQQSYSHHLSCVGDGTAPFNAA